MIEDNEERTRAYIRAIEDVIEAHQERLHSIPGTYIARYEWNDHDDCYDIYCGSCNNYMYDEKALIDIPDSNALCHECSMTEMEKQLQQDVEIENIRRNITSMQHRLSELEAEK